MEKRRGGVQIVEPDARLAANTPEDGLPECRVGRDGVRQFANSLGRRIPRGSWWQRSLMGKKQPATRKGSSRGFARSSAQCVRPMLTVFSDRLWAAPGASACLQKH